MLSMTTTPTLRLPEPTKRMLQTIAREASARRVLLSANSSCRIALSISVIIIVHNQKTSVRDSYTRIALACSVRNLPYEIIFVDRSSNDGSWEEIVQLSLSDSRIHATRKRLGSSDTDALTAAFRVSSGDLVLTLSAGCDEAALINGFMDRLDGDGDILCAGSPVDNEPSTNIYRRLKGNTTKAPVLLSYGHSNPTRTGCKATRTEALWN
jgi:hypothetical protein